MYPVFYRQPRIIYTVAMMQNLVRQALFAGLLVAVTGCDLAGTELRFLVAEHRQFSPAKLAEIIEEQTGLAIIEAVVEPGRDPIAAVRDDEADLALVENSVTFHPGVRAVLPVYESVLHIAGDPNFSLCVCVCVCVCVCDGTRAHDKPDRNMNNTVEVTQERM